jgi:signal transduction histidine kinase
MTRKSDGSEQWPPWLCETVRAVHESLDEANTAPALGARLPSDVAATSGIAFAWVGTTTPNGVRVRSAPPDAALPAELDVPNTDETLTGVVESTRDARMADDGHADTTRVTEQTGVSGDDSTVLAVSLTDGETVYGVLHLYAPRTVTEMPAILPALGRTVGRQLRAFEQASQLSRERGRLEELRSLVSHDLGNPLNIASGRLELAAQSVESSHIGHAETAIERVDAIASRGVDIVEAGHQPDDIEAISLAALAEDCWDDVAEERGTLTVEDATLYGDRERVRRLVDELLANAFDHSDGAITVDIGPLSASRGFYVKDDGPGIPADEREYVVDTGYTTDDDYDGLGLSIVTEIAGAHGWDVSIQQPDSGGTRVEVVTNHW